MGKGVYPVWFQEPGNGLLFLPRRLGGGVNSAYLGIVANCSAAVLPRLVRPRKVRSDLANALGEPARVGHFHEQCRPHAGMRLIQESHPHAS